MKFRGLYMQAMLALLSGEINHSAEPVFASDKPEKQHIPKGCKEYTFHHEKYGEFKTVALNERSAARKFIKWWMQKG